MPNFKGCDFILGDSAEIFNNIDDKIKYKLLLTSPPYYSITDYFWDQWLRIWMLGGQNKQVIYKNKYNNWFINKDTYKSLLKDVVIKRSGMISNNAVIYVSSDARKYSYDIITNILKEVFPEKNGGASATLG